MNPAMRPGGTDSFDSGAINPTSHTLSNGVASGPNHAALDAQNHQRSQMPVMGAAHAVPSQPGGVRRTASSLSSRFARIPVLSRFYNKVNASSPLARIPVLRRLRLRQLAFIATVVAQMSLAPTGLAASKVVEAPVGFFGMAKEALHHVTSSERDTMVLLLASALVTPVMSFLRLSPVLGFLFAGMMLGPTGLALVSDVKSTTKLAELGVVFFLFEMGLELELSRLKAVGKDAFRLGTTQVLITTLALFYAASFFGANAAQALVIGGSFALSSSAFVIQLLSEKGELATRFGRAAFGILLFQDLAVVPLLVVTPLLGGPGSALKPALQSAAIKSVSALAIIFVLGRFLLNRAFRLVARAKDQTSFLSITLLSVISMSTFTHALGLSETLGAFLAGVLLAETKYRYQIEVDIAPFKGLLLGLFFISTGFSIDLSIAAAKAPLILGMSLGLHLTKTLITFLVCVAGGLKKSAALRTGLILSQGGEFAFVLFALAQAGKIFMPAQTKVLLTTVVVTMFLTPFLNIIGAKVAKKLEPQASTAPQQILKVEDEADKPDYVLVCGYGRVGKVVCKLLTSKLIRYKAFDNDVKRVTEAREKDLPVFYGDATRPDVLKKFMAEGESGNISHVVITVENEQDSTRAVRALRREYGDIPIIVRAKDERHLNILKRAGADALDLWPRYGALMLGGALLQRIGVEEEEVSALMEEEKKQLAEDYQMEFQKEEKERKSKEQKELQEKKALEAKERKEQKEKEKAQKEKAKEEEKMKNKIQEQLARMREAETLEADAEKKMKELQERLDQIQADTEVTAKERLDRIQADTAKGIFEPAIEESDVAIGEGTPETDDAHLEEEQDKGDRLGDVRMSAADKNVDPEATDALLEQPTEVVTEREERTSPRGEGKSDPNEGA